MILKLHSSLGDQLLLTGLPEAYYRICHEKMNVVPTRLPSAWRDNPYVDPHAGGPEFSPRPNVDPRDFLIYTPVRVFYEMTGIIVDRKVVHPRIYRPRMVQHRIVLVNDQAGWPSRWGYPYLNELVDSLHYRGWTVHYIRHDGFRNCLGRITPPQIQSYDLKISGGDDATLMSAMSYAALYIGYDSGLAVLASAWGVPSVIFFGAVPPVTTAGDNCIYAAEVCGHCLRDSCDKGCLLSAESENEEILAEIDRRFDSWMQL